jgi:hypothetical protein
MPWSRSGSQQVSQGRCQNRSPARTFTDSLAFHSPFMAVEEVRRFGIAAKIALLPQSNFGT